MSAERTHDGWLVIDKPQGLTSSRVVEQIRRATGAKAGHAGTLDPLATGVLPIALGKATKLVAYAMAARKTYRFRIRWGVARDSDDAEGAIVGESPVRPDPATLAATLPHFIGVIEQVPPTYSAIKIGGRRAYALARAGRAQSPAPRPVEIVSLRLTAPPDRDHADFEAVVGKGAYIRALARDLAIALGTLGHVAALRRLAVGRFTEADAVALEFVTDERHIAAAGQRLLPIGAALVGVPELLVTAGDAERLRCGQPVTLSEPGILPGSIVGAWHASTLVAMAKVEDGNLRPVRVINR
jgi:tRNA pseudouridine55 synthase